jgi:hypothetical protein
VTAGNFHAGAAGSRPPGPQPVVIPGPAGPLQALVEDPGGERHALAVVCHPHPLYHGTMTNKVVHTLARAAVSLGAVAVRFNFRGVGASGGAWDEGRGETDDALAVVEWGRQQWPGLPLWLMGFSFGSYVALRAAPAAHGDLLVTVAPPVRRFPPGDSAPPAARWLIVQGEADELTDFREVREWAGGLTPAPELVLLPETSHFFHGRLGDLRDIVGGFLGKSRGGAS